MRISWSRWRYEPLAGRTLVLGSEWNGNYSHWVLDCLGKYALFLMTGGVPATIQNILIPRPPNEAAGAFLDALGIDRAKIIWSGGSGGFRAEEAVVPTYPGHHGVTHPEVLRFLASRLRTWAEEAPGLGYHPRLAITRDKWSRKLVNRDEILSLLKKHDVLPYPIDDRTEVQHIDFNRATHIVAQHGAALANLLFSRPGTKVVEIHSPDHPHAGFLHMSQALELEHRVVWGTTDRRQKATWNSKGPNSELDVTLDPDLLERALEGLI